MADSKEGLSSSESNVRTVNFRTERAAKSGHRLAFGWTTPDDRRVEYSAETEEWTVAGLPPMNRCSYVIHDSKGGDRRCVLLSCHNGLCDFEPEAPRKIGPLDLIEAHIHSAREMWIASEDLASPLSGGTRTSTQARSGADNTSLCGSTIS